MPAKKLAFHTGNNIHPTAVIDKSAELGANNYIGPYCVVGPNVRIGNDNRFEAFCSLGLAPEHKSYWKGEYAALEIGNDCTFREFVTVNAGTTQDTRVHNNVCLLKGSYVGHDTIVEDDVTVSCNSSMGGHCYIFRGANLGLGVLLHQYAVIGHVAMLGMGTVVTKKSKIEPFGTYVGVPAKWLKTNDVGLKIFGIDAAEKLACEKEYQRVLESHKKLKPLRR